MNYVDDKINEILKTYIKEEILLGDTTFEINDDTALINDNIVDSINLMKLISFIEQKFNVTFTQEDYSVDNFNTIESIVNMYLKKREV